MNPSNKPVSYVSEITEVDNEWVITFPEELIKELGWEEDDVLDWEVQEDGTVLLTKVEEKEENAANS
jgi:bifunctional DNA-binding transcriptional regulator/antitoxin component of YhaV-PrlF toxin-antitoxin module